MTICGIDFGTSNSAIAIVDDKLVTLAKLEDENLTIPSAIFYNHEGVPFYGTAAIESFFMGDEGRLMRSFKRTLGTYLIEYGAIINGKLKRYDHIMAGFLRSIKHAAEKEQGNELLNVVMGRPVHFVDGDDDADNNAQTQLESIAKMAGFKNIEFQFEPIAAAFSHERKILNEKLALVVDIGGGTSDFTVIKLSPELADKSDRSDDILASSGTRVGGNDFDFDFCLNNFMQHFGFKSTYGVKNMEVPLSPFFDMSEWSRVNSLYVPKMIKQLKEIYIQSHDQTRFGRFLETVEGKKGYKILSKVEDAKIQLTAKQDHKIEMDFLKDSFSMNLNRQEFNNVVNHHIDKIVKYINECLKQAKVTQKDINFIILTGGTTEIPLLQKTVKSIFPHAEISEENKFSSIALGLGYDSIRKFS